MLTKQYGLLDRHHSTVNTVYNSRDAKVKTKAKIAVNIEQLQLNKQTLHFDKCDNCHEIQIINS